MSGIGSEAERRHMETEDLSPQVLTCSLQEGKNDVPEVGVDVLIEEMAMRPYTDSYKVRYEGQTIQMTSLDWRNNWLLIAQIAVGWCIFILFGLGEQTLGTIIPRLQKHYGINDLKTALVFLSATSGYFLMAMLSEICHIKIGYRGVGIMGTGCMVVGYVIAGTGPPFGAFIAAYFFVGIGFGSMGASFNGYLGNLINSAPLLGILHGCYGIGCITTPPLVTALINKKTNPWSVFHYYFVLAGVSGFLSTSVALIFRHETATKYRLTVLLNEARRRVQEANLKCESTESIEAQYPVDDYADKSNELDCREDVAPSNSNEPLVEPEKNTSALKSKLVWSISIIIFVYVSGEAAFGAWLVSFCLKIKHLPYQYSSYMAATFWAGLTTGRMGLGFATEFWFKDAILANTIYIAGSLLGFTVFSIAALFNVSAILFPIVFFLGFFVGPVYPTTIVAIVNILPVKLHASGIGFICAFGGGGGAAAPFLIGLVASSSEQGLRFYPMIVTILYAILIVMWAILVIYTKRMKRKQGST
ncbi:hypothetical protein PUMCH_001961 [Australozyma saopauloensis]|uniref:Major facilitator superfamily (MFS) profile domain-containing protein n=1 Tax=Australozyma saopauloensis TaxID=291208 RepID=A0AAX4H854_9ASCO|nr:hypothetical protein PUMCH_001961 [[Candida] saopauloensis]